ncbi:MAG: hypothetical protein P1V51_13645 [Deltaproteobacteria bacterium]|nr:hypothetical protein [Deltaproteobacteria bacterium]
MGNRGTTWIAGFVCLLFVAACPAEKLAPRKVGSAVGRLSVRNAAVMTSLISGNDECGFKSPGVLNNFTVEGDIGSEGSVTYTVGSCQLNLGTLHELKSDCNGDSTSAGGTVTISGTMTIRGILTGNVETPVVPSSADATSIHLEARFTNFDVQVSYSPNSLRQISGALSWDAEPHLAISATTGLCSIATSDISLNNLSYSDAIVHVTAEKRDFDVHVPTSAFSAQVGRWGPRENWISGQITVAGGKVVSLPNDSDDSPVLDVDYERGYHLDSFACAEDLQVPISYQCKSLAPALAHGLSRLTVPTLANLTKLVDADTTCGFSSAGVKNGVQITGNLGETGGSATWRVQNCLIDFPQPVIVSEDCNGAQRIAQGRVTINATKTFTGFRTGDPENPIAPTAWNPAVITLQASFDQHDMQDTGSGNTLTVHSGTLSGIVRPRVAIDTTTGICSKVGGSGSFENLTWQNADVTMRTSSGTFRIAVTGTDLDAQAGPGDSTENSLTGQATIDGQTYTIPVPGEAPDLDPSYDAQAFEDSWASCDPELAVPRSSDECSLNRVLGANAARLMTKVIGNLGSLVNDNTVCGFESDPVRLGPIDMQGDPDLGEMGYVKWTAPNCLVADGPVTLKEADCQNVETYYSGSARVWAFRTVRGEREQLAGLIESVIMRERNAIDMEIADSELTGFSIWDELNGEPTLPVKLIIDSGNISGIVHPILGESATEAGVYDYVSPVSQYEGVTATNLAATMEVGAATFYLDIETATIDAMNGVWLGDGNRIAGTMTINGEDITIGPDRLVPSFDQAAFNASYSCDPTLRAPIPHQ